MRYRAKLQIYLWDLSGFSGCEIFYQLYLADNMTHNCESWVILIQENWRTGEYLFYFS